jgi:hypothetical protein
MLRLLLMSAPVGGGWTSSLPDRFILGIEPRYPLNRRLGKPKGLFGSDRSRDDPACCLDTEPTGQHSVTLVFVCQILGWPFSPKYDIAIL